MTTTLAPPFAYGTKYDENGFPAGSAPADTVRNGGRKLLWIPAKDVAAQKIEWWEHHLIPRGSLTILAGRGDAGKSTSAAAWAAVETMHGGTVAWVHSEESREFHIKPKLTAAGADTSRVMFLDVNIEDGNTVSESRLQLPTDIGQLTDALQEIECRFIVFDALTSFKTSGKSSNSVDDIREFLEPIQAMAAELNAVVLGIAHLGKSNERSARDAVLGSSAWTDVPRSVLAFQRDDETGGGVISDVKGNLSPSPRSIGYRFENVVDTETGGDVGRVLFTGDVDTTADEVRGRDSKDASTQPQSQVQEVRDWLRDYLQLHGPTMKVDVIRDAMGDLRASQRTIERASTAVVASENVGFPRKARWSLATVGETGATGSDLHEYSPATVKPGETVGATVAQLGVTGLTSQNTPSEPSHASSANCSHCDSPMTFPEDIDTGHHIGCTEQISA